MRIILVDDEILAGYAFSDIITTNCPDQEYHYFSNPDLAIKYCQENKVDIAFLDIEMPCMLGTKLALELINLLPNIKIFFLTGYAQTIENLEKIKNNLVGYILKPYDEEEIIKELTKYLS